MNQNFQLNNLITSLLRENKALKEKLEQAYINSSFGCYNRAGAEAKGNEFLQKERRRVASGELVMVCCDIKGMGRRNSEIGEVAVNQAIASCLTQIRQWRGVEFISQLNSGDEFIFVVDAVDVEGILLRMDLAFREQGFNGIYCAATPIESDYVGTAQRGMAKVYEQKQGVKL